jgi:tRNA splicing ligase
MRQARNEKSVGTQNPLIFMFSFKMNYKCMNQWVGLLRQMIARRKATTYTAQHK